MTITALVLAAGDGTRMKSKRPKVTHEMLGKPLVAWSVDCALEAGADRVVVVSNPDVDLAPCLEGRPVTFAPQTERLGTGHAVQTALKTVDVEGDVVLVLYGDTPLLEPSTLKKLIDEVGNHGLGVGVLTMTPPDASGYGRVLYDAEGQLVAIIEHRDCTPEQRELLLECNSGVYCFDGTLLQNHIGELTSDNAQHEYYITDMIAIMRDHELGVKTVCVPDATEVLGVNDRRQLAEATKIMQHRINRRLMEDGVGMLDPDLVWVGPDVTVGMDTTLLPMTFLLGATSVGEDCTIGPNTRLTDTTVADGCSVDETVAVLATIEEGVTTGPRAYLRPGTHLLQKAHVGTSVEIKNSTIGEGSKVPHLSYIGDTSMGSGVNIGAGSITCNYDGYSKFRTTIGDRVFVGSDTMMVAPVTIGDDAVTGAASCITRDVPAGALGLERSEQANIEGFTEKRRKRQEG